MRAEIERHAKLPRDIVEAVDKPVRHLRMKEVDATCACRPVAVQPPGTTIEHEDRGGFAAGCQVKAPGPG